MTEIEIKAGAKIKNVQGGIAAALHIFITHVLRKAPVQLIAAYAH